MEQHLIDTKEEYQKISTRSGGVYQRNSSPMQKQTPPRLLSPNSKLLKLNEHGPQNLCNNSHSSGNTTNERIASMERVDEPMESRTELNNPIMGASSSTDDCEDGNTSTDSSQNSANTQSISTPRQLRKSQRTKRRHEFNNNHYNKRRIDALQGEDDLKTSNRRRLKVSNNNNLTSQKFVCPMCNREDFASLNVFETHLEEAHPDYQIKCEKCNLGFKNHRVLNLHRFMVHHQNINYEDSQSPSADNKSVLGFKDLTFVDFSSEKFPIIAKTICEKSLHRPIKSDDLNFQCDKCLHSFPCASALEIHQVKCLRSEEMDESSREEHAQERQEMSDEEIRRSDFFAGLQLQNKSHEENQSSPPMDTSNTFIPKIRLKQYLTKPELFMMTPPTPNPSLIDSTKDLADIQSIISVTSAQSFLQQLTAPKATPGPQLPLGVQMTPPDSLPRPLHGSLLHHTVAHVTSDHLAHHQQIHEEEQQDQFAAEFRKMKLRGEFPCRLCTAVFPNLRALKGHNRAHLTGNGNGPYRCNMCPHSSTDKAALVRHMRTHNGDRPYECSLCNYAFTTKANCERHLRNRHRKVTREEVKRAIIYHPSEDPTNDESLASASLKGFTPPPSNRSRGEDFATKLTPSHVQSEVKRSLMFGSPAMDLPSSPTPLQIPDLRSVISKMHLTNGTADIPLGFPLVKEEVLTPKNGNQSSLKDHQIFPKLSGALNLSNDKDKETLNPLAVPKIQVKNVNELKQNPSGSIKENDSDLESEDYSNHSRMISTPLSHFRDPKVNPIDLSMDVLDLSKKKREPTPEPQEEKIAELQQDESSDSDDQQPQDLSKKSIETTSNIPTPSAPPPNASIFEKTQYLIAQQLLKRSTEGNSATPNVLNSNFYASQLQNFYNTRPPASPLAAPHFPNIPGFGLNPYFLQPHPFLTPSTSPQEFQEIKERLQKEIIRGLQMSGGGLIMEHLASERLQAFQKQNESEKPMFPQKPDETTVAPLSIETNQISLKQFDSNLRSPMKPKITENIISHTPNSVKMVIKNGVLMPKQKQRRYRTERPFSCEHCSARFTLRSNMERHIKQQHPQFWSQRQRSNMAAGIPGRKPSLQMLPTLQPQAMQSQTSTNLMTNFNLPKEIPPNFTVPNLNDLNKQPLLISDQVKFAILAQQLKQQLQNNQAETKTEDSENISAENEEEEENDMLVIDENSQQSIDVRDETDKPLELLKSEHAEVIPEEQKKNLEEKMNQLRLIREELLLQQQKYQEFVKNEEKECEKNKEDPVRNEDLVPVAKLLDNAAQVPFREYFRRDTEDTETPSEEDEEGLVASGSTSEGNISGSDGNRSESELHTSTKHISKSSSKDPDNPNQQTTPAKKKSAYSLAPNRVTCPYCHRKFPWSSSLRRHILTHTGQKPFKCLHCPLLFTTKSNCDRHLLRKHGNVVGNTTSTSTTPASTVTTSNDAASGNNSNYMMRNVPERPFKCSTCPSSTFSTLSNLKKHMSCKHSASSSSGSISPSSSVSIKDGSGSADDRKLSINSVGSVYDSHSSEDEYNNSTVQKLIKSYKNDWERRLSTENHQEAPLSMVVHNTPTVGSDLPFKCHLCDSSYGERQDALDHIKDQHTSEYELLMSKGALENQNQMEPPNNHSDNNSTIENTNSDEQDEQTHLRGKFPDYANRKVMCAFCMRRFWSAEDLRRHMRTHTGERPFSCDVCRRRFTLKHSMLRHRKKHSGSNSSPDGVQSYGSNKDDEMAQNSGGDDEGGNEHFSNTKENNNNVLIKPRIVVTKDGGDEGEGNNGGGDLIGNLLGIRDSSIIDQVLRSSADDAAKLLGVKKNSE